MKHIKELQKFRVRVKKEPERIIEVSDLVNKRIPKLKIMLVRHNRVNSLEVIRGEEKELLGKSGKVIREIIDIIEQELNVFKEKDLKELESKVERIIKEGSITHHLGSSDF